MAVSWFNIYREISVIESLTKLFSLAIRSMVLEFGLALKFALLNLVMCERHRIPTSKLKVVAPPHLGSTTRRNPSPKGNSYLHLPSQVLP